MNDTEEKDFIGCLSFFNVCAMSELYLNLNLNLMDTSKIPDAWHVTTRTGWPTDGGPSCLYIRDWKVAIEPACTVPLSEWFQSTGALWKS